MLSKLEYPLSKCSGCGKTEILHRSQLDNPDTRCPSCLKWNGFEEVKPR